MIKIASQRGMTLIEILIGVGIFSLFFLILITAIQSVQQQSVFSKQTMEIETEKYNVENLLRQYFSQALDVTYVAGGTNNIRNIPNASYQRGVVVTYDSDTQFGNSSPLDPLAVFWRDANISQFPPPSGTQNMLRRTSIYFQKPTAKTWGILRISPNSVGNPGQDDIIFEGLVRVELMNILTFDPNGNVPPAKDRFPVTSLDAKLTFRRFLGTTNDRRSFCPVNLISTIPDCAIDGNYRDDSRTIRLVLRNNILNNSITSPVVSGSTKWTRVFDTIYFMQPQFLGGLQ